MTDPTALDFSLSQEATNQASSLFVGKITERSTNKIQIGKNPQKTVTRPSHILTVGARSPETKTGSAFHIVEATAEEELRKRQIEEHPNFFLCSANEEWILLEKPLGLSTLQRMKRSYWLTRVVFLRALGLLMCSIFASSWNQDIGLFGTNGILPASSFNVTIHNIAVSPYPPGRVPPPDYTSQQPLGFFAILNVSNIAIRLCSLLGMSCAISVVLLGASNSIIMGTVFFCYTSLIGIGNQWYDSWIAADNLLLMVVFWTIFIVPIWSLEQRPEQVPMPYSSILGIRFALFYSALDLALSKVALQQNPSECRGFPACLTLVPEPAPPIPSVSDWYFSQLPEPWRHGITILVLTANLLFGFFMLVPTTRSIRILSGIGHFIIQLTSIFFGHSDFITWYSLCFTVVCFDDRFLGPFFPEMSLRRLPLLHRAEDICSPWLPVEHFFKVAVGVTLAAKESVERVRSVHSVSSDSSESDFEIKDPIDLLLETSIVLDPLFGQRSSQFSKEESTLGSRHDSAIYNSSFLHSRSNKRLSSMPLKSNEDQDRELKTPDSRLIPIQMDKRTSQHPPNPFVVRRESMYRSVLYIYTIVWLLPLVLFHSCTKQWSKFSISGFFWQIITISIVSIGLGILSVGLLYPPGVLGMIRRSSLKGNITPSSTLDQEKDNSDIQPQHQGSTIFLFFTTAESSFDLRRSASFLWSASSGLLGILLILTCDYGFRWFFFVPIFIIVIILLALANLNLWLPAMQTFYQLNPSTHSHPLLRTWSFANRLNTVTDLAYFYWAKIVTFRGLREITLIYLLLSQGKPTLVYRPKASSSLVNLPAESLFRFEILLEGSSSTLLPNAIEHTMQQERHSSESLKSSPKRLPQWKPISFICRPSHEYSRPCFSFPYEIRLDRMLGIIGSMAIPNDSPVWRPFICRLLQRFDFGQEGDRDHSPLRTIRARRYTFRYSQIGVDRGVGLFHGPWWKKDFVEDIIFEAADLSKCF